MINYTDFGRIIDIKAFTEDFGEDHKIVITFSLNGLVYPEKLADASYTLNRIRSYPDNYVVCDIGEILKAKQKEAADRKELEALKAENEKLKANNKSKVDAVVAAEYRSDCWKNRYLSLEKEFSALKEKKNAEIDQLNKKCDRLEQDNDIKADALIAAKDRGDYWKGKYHDMEREFNLLKQKYDVIFDAGNLHRDENIKLQEKVTKLKDKWDAMYTSLKEKGVEVLYLGDVDGHPVIDVKFADEWLLNNNIMKLISERNLYSAQNKKDKEKIEDLNKDLENSKHLSRFKSELIYEKNQRIKELEERIKELESDRTARVTINPNGSLTFSRDGKSETVLMPLEEEEPTKCVHHRDAGICNACSMETLRFLCADNQHPCKLYEKKEE